MFRVNVLAALDVTLGIARKMAARKRGHIIMMSSTAARSVYRMGVVYCASKFALTALTQGLRLEVQGDGVKVTEIAPGMVDTEIRNSSTHPAWLAALKSRTIVPLTVDDVAAAVVFSAGATDNCCPDLIELRPRGAA
jgi:NADP-dependent 3-hydroxy acid dehydrogenase YdfG